MRLIKGLINVTIFYYLFVSVNPYVQARYEREAEAWFVDTFGGSGEALFALAMVVFSFWVFYQGAIGLFRIITWNEVPSWAKGVSLRSQAWDAFLALLYGKGMRTSGDSYGNSSNIDRVKQYRESKLGTMGDSDKMKEWAKTAGLDSLSSGSNTGRARDYLDSKLGTMDQKEGYEYIKKTFGG